MPGPPARQVGHRHHPGWQRQLGWFLPGRPDPEQAPEAAVELAKFLSSPEGQLSAFDEAGNLPSSPQDFENPKLADFKNPYFNDAPVAKIFVEGAKNLKPVYLGTKNQAVRDAIENDLRSVEQGQRNADEAWQQAIKDAKKAAGV